MPAPQIRDAVDVHVDADAGVDAPGGAEAEIGHLGPHAGQAQQARQGARDVGVVLLGQDGGRLEDVPRLGVVEADFGD